MELFIEKKKIKFFLLNSLLLILGLSFLIFFKKFIPSSFEILFEKENPRVKYFEKIFFSLKNYKELLENKKINVSKYI